MSNSFTVRGNVGADPQLRFTPAGKGVAEFSVADTPRRKNQNGQWEDAGHTLWVRVQVREADAELVTETVRKGDGVTVTGRLRQERWTDKNGTEKSGLSLMAESVARHGKHRTMQTSAGRAETTFAPPSAEGAPF